MVEKTDNTFLRSCGMMIATFVIGFIYINYFLSSRDIDHIPKYQIYYPAFFMAIIAFFATILIRRKQWWLVIPSLLGIFIGVAFDALTDTKVDRNLFPIEMVLWTVLSIPGVIVGIAIASQIIKKAKTGRP